MIFDFNIPYSPSQTDPYAPSAGFFERAEKATEYALDIPVRIIFCIACIAKLALYGIACAFSFGQSRTFNRNFMHALQGSLVQPLYLGISILGIFAPMNAEKLERQLP